MISTVVLKRRGQRKTEPFDSHKLRRSIEASCLSVRLSDGVANDTAKRTIKLVEQWIGNKPEVTSEDIRRVTADALTQVSPEAGYLYQHHKSII